uniref:phosphoglycerate mutase (2,3-diphosphoglycerate-dependent) n=1 Tax=Chromera velia CCMP2878 TaxID=1169474 RepID=A0A0G4I3Y2_9ALVE|eukprot:Cvel_1776.t1-p1 / transcript=Cvel_1776.t1 / gene=Cvel_1776 / organism=Chromera_velia_CCMP2878 / gene_product=2,3-bisphosphoglycerate-dependent phosphoglycerate, putative / transcript_product=2,3-bisphosphoglycerate-dependent phosphoglycerate, putative / location=Cvel_scaffold65:52852-56392(+) / protein_length=392 / sequence_SO=supercontig / SO=protein_coding / is_pseudo=false
MPPIENHQRDPESSRHPQTTVRRLRSLVLPSEKRRPSVLCGSSTSVGGSTKAENSSPPLGLGRMPTLEDEEMRMADYMEQMDHYKHFYSPGTFPDHNLILQTPMRPREDKVPPRLILIRHGRSTWNLEGRMQGWADPPLADVGHDDARKSALKLLTLHPPVDTERIFCSDLERSRATCKYVLDILRRQRHIEFGEFAEDFPLDMREDQRLRERHYGAFSGHLKSENTEVFGSGLLEKVRRGAFERPPVGGEPHCEKGGESLKDCQDRVKSFVHEEMIPRLNRGEDVVIVGHNNLIRSMLPLVDLTLQLEFVEHVPPPKQDTPLVFHIGCDTAEECGVDPAEWRGDGQGHYSDAWLNLVQLEGGEVVGVTVSGAEGEGKGLTEEEIWRDVPYD